MDINGDFPSQENSKNFQTTKDLENLKNHRHLHEEVSRHSCDNCTWLHITTRISAIFYAFMIPILGFNIIKNISMEDILKIITLIIEKDNWIFNLMIVLIFGMFSFLTVNIGKRLWM